MNQLSVYLALEADCCVQKHGLKVQQILSKIPVRSHFDSDDLKGSAEERAALAAATAAAPVEQEGPRPKRARVIVTEEEDDGAQ